MVVIVVAGFVAPSAMVSSCAGVSGCNSVAGALMVVAEEFGGGSGLWTNTGGRLGSV